MCKKQLNIIECLNSIKCYSSKLKKSKSRKKIQKNYNIYNIQVEQLKYTLKNLNYNKFS